MRLLEASIGDDIHLTVVLSFENPTQGVVRPCINAQLSLPYVDTDRI